METVVAPGPGQGQAYIWKPDNSLSDQIYRMGQTAALNKARLDAAQKAKDAKAREDMEKVAMSKPGEYGFYQNDWDGYDNNFKTKYFQIQDPEERRANIADYESKKSTYGANNLVLKDLLEKSVFSNKNIDKNEATRSVFEA